MKSLNIVGIQGEYCRNSRGIRGLESLPQTSVAVTLTAKLQLMKS